MALGSNCCAFFNYCFAVNANFVACIAVFGAGCCLNAYHLSAVKMVAGGFFSIFGGYTVYAAVIDLVINTG